MTLNKTILVSCFSLLSFATGNVVAKNDAWNSTLSVEEESQASGSFHVSSTENSSYESRPPLSADEKYFMRSKNVKTFLHKHPDRKFLLQRTMDHLNLLDSSEKAFLLKNLRQIAPNHFRSFIEELRKVDCQCAH